MKKPRAETRRTEDTCTILEPIEALKSLYGQPSAAQGPVPLKSAGDQPVAAHHLRTSIEPLAPGGQSSAALAAGSAFNVKAGAAQEVAFRPVMRPPTPRLTLLDDGESNEGEVVRLRERVTLVGRNDGHIRLPHDPLVSGKHAEIIREGSGTASRWILRDLGSSNGTFVCCSKTVLRPDRLIILGSRRYRFRLPQEATKPFAGDPSTMMVDSGPLMNQVWPALVETTQPDSNAQILLAGMTLSVGRPGYENRIELDDPLIAAHHAEIRREASGDWVIEARPSRNGIWVQIGTIRLSDMCRFQCGEQRFWFHE